MTAAPQGSHRPAATPRPGERTALKVPARSAYLGLVRTVVASVAAASDFSVDDIEDLRMAADEAAALLMSGAHPDAVLHLAIEVLDDGLAITVTAPSSGVAITTDSFAWTVLSTLADTAEHTSQGDSTTIAVTKRRSDELPV
ncbi:MAG TPA: anti-sigma regulatory factor [Mycobacteriales bacterium]|nr:anti-sigma regulatory factor [Mycobacteriales bacterium]